jgi:hypothetical protein
VSSSRNADDDTLPLAAGAGLGILLLAGGAIALGRRKREDELYEEVVTAPTAAPVMASMANPSESVRATYVPPVITAAPRQTARSDGDTKLPAGFDLSRFGPHVQQAYRGPTPDNPSYSLRKRLHRAAFFDQRERIMGEGKVEAPSVATAARTAAPAAQPNRNAEYVMSRVNAGRRPDFRPAYQN